MRLALLPAKGRGNVTVVDERPVIDIHIRISRKFVFWVIAVLLALFFLSFALASVGHGSGGMQRGPIQTEPSH